MLRALLLVLGLAASWCLVTCGLEYPSSLPTEHRKLAEKEYEKFMKQRGDKKSQGSAKPSEADQDPPTEIPKAKGISPKKLGMRRRESNSTVPLTDQVHIPQGVYWFGSQFEYKGKISPVKASDGAAPRKKVTVRDFMLDIECVTTAQFQEFVESTHYRTEAELFRWSFVMETQVSEAVKKEVDGPQGIGRVKTARHWMAVMDASWKHPYGHDSDADDYLNYPAVHISYNDAVEYCSWAGRRLPTEKEWEFAARNHLINASYPWGDDFRPGLMNIWDSETFPALPSKLVDGYAGLAPVKSYPPNGYGLYNMLGNVWEWVQGGTADKRVLRGGSFIDSIDGKFNHAVMVSTRQMNSGDSSASNTGLRCASDDVPLQDEDEF